jgi:GT2 family glycosyltransferase
MKIDIVIVNWNSGSYLKNCIASISKYHNNLVSRVIIVDNNSTDSSLNFALPSGLNCEIIHNKNNAGFAAACNQGAFKSSSKFILFLNPDAELHEKSLAKPVLLMESEDFLSVGIIGIKMVDETGAFSTSCARFPRPRIYFGKSLGLNIIFNKYFYDLFLKESECNKSMYVDEINGAFLLIKRDVFCQLKGFDERFFVYFDEVDLCYRSHKLGYKAYYFHEATAFHKGGGCTDSVRSTRLFYSLRSRLQYSHKHFSLFGQIVVTFSTLFIEPISRFIVLFLKTDKKQIKELLNAYRMLFGWIVK